MKRAEFHSLLAKLRLLSMRLGSSGMSSPGVTPVTSLYLRHDTPDARAVLMPKCDARGMSSVTPGLTPRVTPGLTPVTPGLTCRVLSVTPGL